MLKSKMLLIILIFTFLVFNAISLLLYIPENKVVEKEIIIKNYTAPELKTKVEPSSSYSESYWKGIKKEIERFKDPEWIATYYTVCDVNCFVTESMSEREISDFFASLENKNSTVYFMIQFDVLGAEPWLQQINQLKKMRGIELVDHAGRYTSYAKGNLDNLARKPNTVFNALELEPYSFVRWVGIKSPEGKINPHLRDKLLGKNCTGTMDSLILFYEPLSPQQEERFNKAMESIGRIEHMTDEGSAIKLNVERIISLTSLEFVKEVDTLPKFTALLDYREKIPEYDPYENIKCDP